MGGGMGGDMGGGMGGGGTAVAETAMAAAGWATTAARRRRQQSARSGPWLHGIAWRHARSAPRRPSYRRAASWPARAVQSRAAPRFWQAAPHSGLLLLGRQSRTVHHADSAAFLAAATRSCRCRVCAALLGERRALGERLQACSGFSSRATHSVTGPSPMRKRCRQVRIVGHANLSCPRHRSPMHTTARRAD